MLGLLICASSAITASKAGAAEIVEVRVGRHAGFTRVVFELDRATGYRIERSDPTSDVAELVISLEASSIPRRIQSSKSLIQQVEVEPAGTRSIARIRLTKSGLRLKEMILANPPRIVLDIIADQEAVSTVAKAAKAKPVPIPAEEAVPSLDEPTFEELVAQIPTEPEPAAAPVTPLDVPDVMVEPEPVIAAVVEGIPEVVVVDEPTTSTPIEEPETDDSELLVDQVSDSERVEIAQVEPTPPPKRTTRPMVVKSKPSTEKGTDWMTWAFAGIGAVVVLLGGVLVARRMAGGEEVDFADDETGSEFGEADPTQTGSDENPFENISGDGSQMTLGTAGADSGDTTSVSLSDEEKESESVVFGDSEEKSMDDMEVISRDQVNESLGGMPPAVGGIPEEFQQMMREMNRRVESLEGRIDELVDGRDRLERQVAAQTEELRVQRAAIARTQRAVRNLARPEGGEDEKEATEPALRDPNQTS